MAKPRIIKTRLGRYSCSMCNTEMGFGGTPKEAYQDWLQENVGRRIDLGRYAGTYGGTSPDRDVAAYAALWAAIYDHGRQIAIGTLIAVAATLWVASWMFSR